MMALDDDETARCVFLTHTVVGVAWLRCSTLLSRALPCGGRFERRHDLTSLSSATFEACLVLQRSIPDGQPFYEEGRLFSAPRFAALRAASRALPQARPPLARYDCGDQRRFRLPASRPCYFSPILLLTHVLLGRLEFAAKPAANVGFHWVPRCSRGLDTTALLALECPAVAARGSALDPGAKHSRVIADRAARPPDRGEVGWVDRLIFRHSTSPRRRVTLGHRRLPRLDGDGSTMSLRRSDSLVNTAHFPILI